jgi:hypothetical protein
VSVMFAERALRAVMRGDGIIVVPTWWKVIWYLERLSPALSMRAARVPLKRIRELASTAAQNVDRAALGPNR